MGDISEKLIDMSERQARLETMFDGYQGKIDNISESQEKMSEAIQRISFSLEKIGSMSEHLKKVDDLEHITIVQDQRLQYLERFMREYQEAGKKRWYLRTEFYFKLLLWAITSFAVVFAYNSHEAGKSIPNPTFNNGS
jgi:DNA repair ATPase RecN